MLKAKLPEMYGELEKCSKALEGYLEQKRSKFPRFYFCSNSKLLQILSQGSDPTTMNAHYETVFDALEKVDHDKKDKVRDSVLKLNLNLLGWRRWRRCDGVVLRRLAAVARESRVAATSEPARHGTRDHPRPALVVTITRAPTRRARASFPRRSTTTSSSR